MINVTEEEIKAHSIAQNLALEDYRRMIERVEKMCARERRIDRLVGFTRETVSVLGVAACYLALALAVAVLVRAVWS